MRPLRPAGRLALLLALQAVLPGLAEARDCTHRTSALDEAVCASPRLLALDGEIDVAFQKAMARNADEPAIAADERSGAERQAGWRAFTERWVDCLTRKSGTGECEGPAPFALSELEALFARRLTQLRSRAGERPRELAGRPIKADARTAYRWDELRVVAVVLTRWPQFGPVKGPNHFALLDGELRRSATANVDAALTCPGDTAQAGSAARFALPRYAITSAKEGLIAVEEEPAEPCPCGDAGEGCAPVARRSWTLDLESKRRLERSALLQPAFIEGAEARLLTLLHGEAFRSRVETGGRACVPSFLEEGPFDLDRVDLARRLAVLRNPMRPRQAVLGATAEEGCGGSEATLPLDALHGLIRFPPEEVVLLPTYLRAGLLTAAEAEVIRSVQEQAGRH